MASSFRKAFLVPWKPEIQCLRFRNKINIQRPALPHYQRAKVLRIVQPTFIQPEKITRPSVDLCLKPVENKKEKKDDNPYVNILAKELYRRTDEANFVGIAHRNPTSNEEQFRLRCALLPKDATLKVYGRAILEKALLNTYYEPILCLFATHSAIVFGEDGSPKTVASIMKILRRSPSLVLMAAIIDKRLMDRSELEKYSRLTDLTTERAQLVAALHSAAGGRLVQDLTSHQIALTQKLDQHIKQASSSGKNDQQLSDHPVK